MRDTLDLHGNIEVSGYSGQFRHFNPAQQATKPYATSVLRAFTAGWQLPFFSGNGFSSSDVALLKEAGWAAARANKNARGGKPRTQTGFRKP